MTRERERGKEKVEETSQHNSSILEFSQKDFDYKPQKFLHM